MTKCIGISLSIDGAPCQNQAHDGRYFCKSYLTLYDGLYKSYKDLSNERSTIEARLENEESLMTRLNLEMKIYQLLSLELDKRVQFQKEAVHYWYHDWGHRTVIEKLKESLVKCEKLWNQVAVNQPHELKTEPSSVESEERLVKPLIDQYIGDQLNSIKAKVKRNIEEDINWAKLMKDKQVMVEKMIKEQRELKQSYTNVVDKLV